MVFYIFDINHINMSNNFHIPKPCSENWSTMSDVERGKFCEVCHKKVFDLTSLNNTEIQNLLKSENSLCGRIKVNNPNSLFKFKKYGIALSLASILGFTSLNAKENSVLTNLETSILYVNNSIQNDTIILKGTVKEDKMPLPGVIIKLKGTKLETTSDFGGNFSFIIPKKDVPQELILIFNYIGYETKEVEIKKYHKKIEVELTSENILLGEVVIIKKSLWKRIFG